MPGNLTKTVKVIVAGDSHTLQSALDKASSKSQSAASAIRGHFTTLFNSLNQSGQLSGLMGEFSGVMSALDGIELKGKSISAKLAGIGAGVAGAGAMLTMGAQGDIQAHQQLAQAFTDTGHNLEDYKDKLEAAIKTGAKYGDNSKEVMRSLQDLVQASHDPEEAFKRMSLAENLAAAKHVDLATASEMVAKIMAGKGARALAEFGLQSQTATASLTSLQSAQHSEQTATENLAKAHAAEAAILKKFPDAANPASKAHAKYEAAVQSVTKAQQQYDYQTQHLTEVQQAFTHPLQASQANLDALAKVTKGQAAAASDTLTGKMKELRAELENHLAEWGQKYGPTITAAGAGMTVLGSTIKATQGVMDMFRSTTEATTAAQEVLTGAEAASGAAADGLAAGETAADAAGMPLILTIGLIVLAVAAVIAIIYELVKHWKEVFDTIKHVVSDVVDWIKGHWQLLVAIFTGPIGAVVMLVVHFRDQIIGFFDDMWHGAIHKVEQFGTDIVNFFTSLPGQLASVGAHMWDWMLDGLKLIEHGIADIWNNSIGSLSFHVPSWVPGIGGDGFSMPKIPYMALGGTTAASMPYIVGERGPEMFVPQSAGTVIPHGQLADYLGRGGSQGGGKTVNVTQNIYLPTGTPEEFGRESSWHLGRLVS